MPKFQMLMTVYPTTRGKNESTMRHACTARDESEARWLGIQTALCNGLWVRNFITIKRRPVKQ